MSNKPKVITKALVDGDVIVYRSAFATQDKPPGETEDVIDQLMEHFINQTVVFPTEDNFKTYITGRGNFRYEIAKTAEYKGNRRDVAKPLHYQHARDYLMDKWDATLVEGKEADDAIATEAHIGSLETTVIISVDKDFNTVPTWRYDFAKGTWEYYDAWKSLLFFYQQILEGDRVDNIKGIKGVGPKKAQKLLEGATTEEELFQKCLDAYEGDYDRVVENARLLHLQRYEDELWSPPDEKE